MAVPWEAVGSIVALVAIGFVKSLYNGHARDALTSLNAKRQVAKDAHAAIPEVAEQIDNIDTKTDRIYEKVESVEHKTDRNRYLILELHGGEEVTVPVEDLADEENDFYRGNG